MDKINFDLQDCFPFTIKSATELQKMIALIGQMANLGGSTYVLSGCEESGDEVSDGYIVINGELLPFKGSAIKSKVVIVEERENATAFGKDYPDAYVKRYATFGTTGDLLWQDVKRVISNMELWERVEDIKGDPPGIRVGWCGYLDKIPGNWMLCDGRALKIDEYPELFKNIGTQFGAVGTTEFKLPDMRERFVVAHSGDGDYKNVGYKGGEDAVTLTKKQLPSHNHVNNDMFNRLSARASDLDTDGTAGSVDAGNPEREYRVGRMSETLWKQSEILSVGENEAHENRPPFFVEAFIIKVKY